VPPDFDVYQPPKAETAPAATAEKLYSPRQVAVATFLGSPIAGCCLLGSNYAVLGRPGARVQALLVGVVASAVVIGLAFILPKNFPNTVLPIAYTYGVYGFAEQFQRKTHEARFAAAGQPSYWKVVGIGVASLILILGLIVVAAIVTGYEG
jgi:hypothetical protein